MSDNIKVVVKVRPLIPREIEDKLVCQWRIKSNTLYLLDQNGKETGQNFTFDKVYTEDTKTTDVYKDVVKPIVEAATAGINGTIFAYGQTSSGKTYTMTGTEESPGIIPLAVQDLFHIIKNIPDRDFLVRVSYIEIYNDTINDMLNVEKRNVKVFESLHQQGLKVDAEEKILGTPEEVLKLMEIGQANRHVGSTNMNEESSRSHSIFQITIESREHVDDEEEMGCVNVSQLNLVDLAGSERSGQTGAKGMRFVEGTHINKSLSTLALVIRQLSEEPRKFINYRDSKLTRILQNSLGGNARTCIVCAVTPAAAEETISTLQFANRAKVIKNKPEVNAVSTSNTMLQNLTRQMCKLQSQLESKKNLEKDNVYLQKQLVALQQLIINGFNQRSTKNIDGIQKKQSQLRRATISALPSNEKDMNISPPQIKPKFSTPILKYNPACIEGAPEYSAYHGSVKPTLSPVHEENTKTPPRKKTVNFDSEIIEIDSGDEENTSDVKLCSPVHDCYDSSKTPPCVLRKTVKQVERNLKEHIEMTELEKMYSPRVVELIQQLQEKTTIINEMKEEKNKLYKQIKDRDFEVDVLKHKIHKTEEEMKSTAVGKIDLEMKCFDIRTKLTDLEVLYETLKNKSKLRENELLSLIENKKNRIPSTPNLLSHKTQFSEKVVTNFMDLSKDISLVNSDNENSMDVHTGHINEQNETVVELETKVEEQKLHNAQLQKTIEDLQLEVTDYHKKIKESENDRHVLKSIIESLESKISRQETDITSYNDVIRELQIKLTKKELTNIQLNDSAIESILNTEENLFNNSDNLKIVCQLKQAIHTRDSEISGLKSSLDLLELNNGSENITLRKQLQDRDDHIANLMENVHTLKEQNNQYLVTIKRLNENIVDFEGQITKLKEQNMQNVGVIEDPSTQISNQNLTVQDKTKELESLSHNLENKLQNKEEELLSANTKIYDLTEEIKQHLCMINQLKEKVTCNNNQISSQLAVIKEINDKVELLLKDKNDLNAIIKEKDDALELSLGKIDELKRDVMEKNKHIKCLEDASHSESYEIKQIMDTYSKEREDWVILERQLIEKLEHIQNRMETSEKILLEKNIQIDELKSTIENMQITILKRDNDLHTLNHTNEDLADQNRELTYLVSELRETVQGNKLLITSVEENRNSETKSLITQLQKIIDKITGNKVAGPPENNIEKPELLTDILHRLESTVSEIVIEKQNLNTQLSESTEMYTAEIMNLKGQMVDEERKLSEIIVQNKELALENARLSEELDRSLKCCAQFEQKFNIINLTQQQSCNIIVTPKTEKHKTCTDCDCFHKVLPNLLHLVSITSNSTHSIDTSDTFAHTTSEKILMLIQMLDENIKYSIRAKNIQESILLEDINNEEEYKSETETCMHKLLKYQLQQKSIEIQELQSKSCKLKKEFENLGLIMKKQLNELQSENIRLKAKCHNRLSYSLDTEEDNMLDKLMNDLSEKPKNSPPSLLSICLKNIDYLLKSEQSEPEFNNSVSENEQELQTSCNCPSLLLDYEGLKKTNSDLMIKIRDLNIHNKTLLNEQEEVRSEINLLLELIKELQKKIFNHRTNLSTLTATTYAENQLLQTQVKALQHHHNRFYNACIRDIPSFKKQLEELRTILKDDESNNYKHNVSFKRYSLPDVLDNNCLLPNTHNESTLDGDLLMLDTNVTIATLDSTLLDLDQTHTDTSQITKSDLNKMNSTYNSTVPLLSEISSSMNTELSLLNNENKRLEEQIIKLSLQKEIKDAQTNQTEIRTDDIDLQNTLLQKIEKLTNELFSMAEQKKEIETNYQKHILEIPVAETLVKKITVLEQEIICKNNEANKLKCLLDGKTKQLNGLQVEYDEISTQVIDTISEVDTLKEEIKTLKENNKLLKDECFNLEKMLIDNKDCKASVCIGNNAIVSHKHLNRSLSDSDSCSSYNTICTLQKELCAGKEECKQLTEEVTTIKNHLEQSNLSAMDLDQSVNDSNVFTTSSTQNITKPLQPIKENVTECLEYIIDKTGLAKSEIDCNVTLIDLMKILHDKLVLEHGNEIQNLLNHVKILEDAKVNLKDEICCIKKELQDTSRRILASNSKMTQIKNNIDTLNNNLNNLSCGDETPLSAFRDSVLVLFDNEYDTNSAHIFNCIMDSILKKNENTLHEMINSNKQLQQNIANLVTEKHSVLANLEQLQNEMDKKEQDYNTLKTQKEMIHEISEAVTLDIIKKEKDFNQTIIKGCEKLIENNIICPHEFEIDAPAYINLNMLIENIIKQRNTEKENIMLEIKHSKELLNKKELEVEELQKDMDKINIDAEKITENVIDYAKKLESQNALYEDLKNVYETKKEENIANIKLIEKLTEEIVILKQTLSNKEEQMQMLERKVNKGNLCNECNGKESYILDLSEKIKRFEQEIQILRTANDVINSEKDSLKHDLEKANTTIKENSLEMEKMKCNIMVLEETITENLCFINRLKEEAKSLLEQNSKLKEQFLEKSQAFSRLEINIKTHEKTAEIQSKMIMRLTTQHNSAIQEKDLQIEEILTKQSLLLKQYEECLKDSDTAKENIEKLLTIKEDLERRVAQLERERDEKQRFSTDSSTDHSKKRRQSLHDSKRFFGDQVVEDDNKLEALFQARSKLDDLFMDVDEDNSSNRTSPIKIKKNDSNQSRLEEVSQESSRPSSVTATRRRRQSVHDSHRSVVHSPHEQSVSPFLEDTKHSDSTNTTAHKTEASQLKERIAMYLEEIEELKQRNKELDEECDTCAEYLKERDEQCLRLKKEKSALEKIIEELKDKVKTYHPQQSQLEEAKRLMVNASVNTDEDWANLHSVVVDRMSYDAEVDKNKRLTKVIEELRYKKQELRTTIGKMQAALDRNSRKESHELEELKTELEVIKQELNEVKQRNKELDEECDTCAQYLREREQQCRKLKEAKESLEARLEEFHNDHSISQSVRKRRQSFYDQNRPSNLDLHDACTQIGDDLVTYQMECAVAAKKTSDDARELQRLKMTVDKLLHQKATLEQQVVRLTATVQPALYVATGSAIVQNQQITDVMKENQKLKKMNAKLVSICKKRGKMLTESNIENEDPMEKTQTSNM